MTVAESRAGSSFARPSSVRAPRLPNSRPSIRTVVSAGRHAAPNRLSSNPMTARSSGADSPRSARPAEYPQRHLVVESGDRRHARRFAAQRGDGIPSAFGVLRYRQRVDVVESESSAGLEGQSLTQLREPVEIDLGRNGEGDRPVAALGEVCELGERVGGETVDPAAVVGVGARLVDLGEVDDRVRSQIADQIRVTRFARRAGVDQQPVAVRLQLGAHALDEALQAAPAAQPADRQQDDPALPLAKCSGKAVGLVAERRRRGTHAVSSRRGECLARASRSARSSPSRSRRRSRARHPSVSRDVPACSSPSLRNLRYRQLIRFSDSGCRGSAAVVPGPRSHAQGAAP